MSTITSLPKTLQTPKRIITRQSFSTSLMNPPPSLGFETIASQTLGLKSSRCSRTTAMATYKIKLLSPEGLEQVFDAPDDAYILDSAEMARIDMPFSCRAGTCSMCTGRMASGSVDQNEGSFLDESHKEKGYVLTCIAYPREDCVIHTHKENELF